MTNSTTYSVALESKKILEHGILKNPKQKLPLGSVDLAAYIEYTGSPLPSIPINWRFAESIASLKGLEAIMINHYLQRRFGVGPYKVSINTDHAQLFVMSSLLVEVNPQSDELHPTPVRDLSDKYANYFRSYDVHNASSSLYRRAVQNILRTKDGKFFHVHPLVAASLNPDPTLRALGMPLDDPTIQDVDESFIPMTKRVAESTAAELDQLLGEQARQAATICHSPEEFDQTPHGQANAHVGLYEVTPVPGHVQAPCWLLDDEVAPKDPRRPLLGVRVVDLTRVIAGPSITRSLAELGASVMRVTAPHLADFSGLLPDLNWGKWNCHLDLRREEDRTKMRELVLQADIVVDGYRPGVFDKYGFGAENVLEMCKDRSRGGIVYLRENSFGWHGEWSHRSGWQPISDANSGVSWGFGRAMGNDEPVTPVFPNSDYCTGVIGSSAALDALLKRGEKGGSYRVDIALNYYNTWLIRSVGEYPPSLWDELWTRHGRQVFRHNHSMNYTLPRYLAMLKDNTDLFQPEYFETRYTKALGIQLRAVKPVLNFEARGVELRYNVGTRGNGVDKPVWPSDPLVEVVV